MTDALGQLVSRFVPGAKVGRGLIRTGERQMNPTEEYVEKELVSIRQQKENAITVFKQATGAEAALLAVLEHLKEEAGDGKKPEKPDDAPRAKNGAGKTDKGVQPNI